LKVYKEDDALTPSTVPLSIRVDVPSAVEVSQRVAYPNAPPVIPPAVTVEDHDISPEPSVTRACPADPVVPGRVKIMLLDWVEEELICVVKAFPAEARYRRPVEDDGIPMVRLVVEALVKIPLVEKKLVEVELVITELVAKMF
jgi:hypothetical protein